MCRVRLQYCCMHVQGKTTILLMVLLNVISFRATCPAKKNVGRCTHDFYVNTPSCNYFFFKLEEKLNRFLLSATNCTTQIHVTWLFQPVSPLSLKQPNIAQHGYGWSFHFSTYATHFLCEIMCNSTLINFIIWPTRPCETFLCKTIGESPIWGPYAFAQAGPEKAVRPRELKFQAILSPNWSYDAALGPYAMTSNQIFSHPARSNLVNKYFNRWPIWRQNCT